MILHGDGSPTRKYLFGSDAAEAFDNILRKGSEGEIYNIGSFEEIANKDLYLLLEQFGITKDAFPKWVEFSKDRPFNDLRYAVDGVERYRQFGDKWWIQ